LAHSPTRIGLYALARFLILAFLTALSLPGGRADGPIEI
jgi:hypothetical protein